MSLFGLIPGPIIFGHIVDSACLIWNYSCGRQGNCLLYDAVAFRERLHSGEAFFFGICVCFDILILYYGRNLDLYGNSDEDKGKNAKENNGDSTEIEPLNTNK